MARRVIFIAWIFLAVTVTGVRPQTPEAPPFRTERLSENVLLLTEISPMENIIVALSTNRGLVVVDATGSPYTAGLLRKVVEKEFGRDDFAYVIQTHYHWDHAWGNTAFPHAKIVAHEAALNLVDSYRQRLPDILSSRKQGLQELEEGLAALAPGSQEWESLAQTRDFQQRTVRGMEGDFEFREPDITFNDSLTLDLGNLTLRLTFFGRAHSGNDILIQVPEEELLLTGDLFLDIGWLPLFAGQEILDVPRWIQVMARALDGKYPVSTVIPGHRKSWSREKFHFWREYIVDLWEGLNLARAEGATLEEALSRFPLKEKALYLLELGHTQEELDRFHRRNAEAFWRQISGT